MDGQWESHLIAEELYKGVRNLKAPLTSVNPFKNSKPCSLKHFGMLKDKNSPYVAISMKAGVEAICRMKTIVYRSLQLSCWNKDSRERTNSLLAAANFVLHIQANTLLPNAARLSNNTAPARTVYLGDPSGWDPKVVAALGHLPPSISPWNGKICLEEPRKPLHIAEEAFLLVVLGLKPSCYSQPQLLVTWLPTVPAWMEGIAPAHDLAGHFLPQCYCQATVGWSRQAACTTSWVPLLLRQLLLCNRNGELALCPTKTWAGHTLSFWPQELRLWAQKFLPLRGEGPLFCSTVKSQLIP